MQKDAIVVLGSGISVEGELFPRTKNRVDQAVQLYQDQVASRIIFSGGFSSKREEVPMITEAEAMKRYALSLGALEKDIFLETHSKESFGNVLFTKLCYLEPQGWNDVVVVTSSYHVERVRFLCQKILGSDFKVMVEGVEPGLPPDLLQKKIEGEQSKLAFIRDHLAHIQDGDDEALKEHVLNVHTAYKDDPAVRNFLCNPF